MVYCKECDQPCLSPYGDTCRNCHEKLEARRHRNWDRWEPEVLGDWCPKKKQKNTYRVAHPSMDSAPRRTKEEVDG